MAVPDSPGQCLHELIEENRVLREKLTKAEHALAGTGDSGIAAHRDTEEKKHAPGELEKKVCFFRSIIDADPTLIYVKDRQGRIVLANRSLADFFGIATNELIGKTTFECTPDKEAAERMYRDDLEILGRNASRVERECRFRDGAGRDQWVYIIKLPIKDHAGNAEQLIGVSVVITERKMMEETIVRREKELSTKARELEAINTALEVLLRKREQDKKELMENVVANIEELILPCLEKLESTRLDDIQKTYVDIVKSGLSEISSPFMKQLPQRYTGLSIMEVRVANLIKAGKGNKDIARTLAVSLNTVMTHRYHLRTKLGVRGKKINLRSYLNSIQLQ